jgi:hypothetical protein
VKFTLCMAVKECSRDINKAIDTMQRVEKVLGIQEKPPIIRNSVIEGVKDGRRDLVRRAKNVEDGCRGLVRSYQRERERVGELEEQIKHLKEINRQSFIGRDDSSLQEISQRDLYIDELELQLSDLRTQLL